jgi:penicillin-binding protein 1A
VWIGHDDNRPMPGMQGGGAPAAIFRTFMSRALGPAGEPAAPAPQRELPPERGERGPPPVIREYDVEDEPLSEEEWWARQSGQEGENPDGPVVVDVPELEVPVRPPPLIAPPPVVAPENAPPPDPAETD